MNTDFWFAALSTLVGVGIGSLLTFLSQYFLNRQQQKSELRRNAMELKNDYCLKLWGIISDIYQYLYFSGKYKESKLDLVGLGNHIKKLNVAIILIEPFISHKSFIQLMSVRDTINNFFSARESGKLGSYKEHMAFVKQFDGPITEVRDIVRKELNLEELDVVDLNPG